LLTISKRFAGEFAPKLKGGEFHPKAACKSSTGLDLSAEPAAARHHMAMAKSLILGEFRRALDERYRVSIPPEMAELLTADGDECVLAKERAGALSLWNTVQWQEKFDRSVHLVQEKMLAGRLDGRVEDVQVLGRLLSTRQTNVKLAGRSRLVLPEGFREFLGVEPGGEVLVVGAALCVELWRPDCWFRYVEEQMPGFRRLFDNLSS
jgi:MraZ protein